MNCTVVLWRVPHDRYPCIWPLRGVPLHLFQSYTTTYVHVLNEVKRWGACYYYPMRMCKRWSNWLVHPSLSLSLLSLLFLAQKLPDLDFQALTHSVMATRLPKTAKKTGIDLARNQTAVGTRARIVAFVFAMPISHARSQLFSPCAQLSLVGKLVRWVCVLESSS